MSSGSCSQSTNLSPTSSRSRICGFRVPSFHADFSHSGSGIPRLPACRLSCRLPLIPDMQITGSFPFHAVFPISGYADFSDLDFRLARSRFRHSSTCRLSLRLPRLRLRFRHIIAFALRAVYFILSGSDAVSEGDRRTWIMSRAGSVD